MQNPYQAPGATVASGSGPTEALDDAARGQKLVIYAILLYFVAAALRAQLGAFAILIALPCLVMSWTGIYKIGRGLGYPEWLRVLHMLLMLVPLVGLLMLLVLSSRTTSRLKRAGYSVGLLGARA